VSTTTDRFSRTTCSERYDDTIQLQRLPDQFSTPYFPLYQSLMPDSSEPRDTSCEQPGQKVAVSINPFAVLRKNRTMRFASDLMGLAGEGSGYSRTWRQSYHRRRCSWNTDDSASALRRRLRGILYEGVSIADQRGSRLGIRRQ
jgi:hypothetical protein